MFGEPRDYTGYDLEVPDSGVLELVCYRRHRTVICLPAERHRMLFDTAASALVDGYPREAVASFAAGVERYYEYLIRVLLTANEVPEAEVQKGWKAVGSDSQRQLGAFRLLFLSEFRVAAPQLPDRLVAFRNNVIHKGYFPTEQEAMEFGETCFNHVAELAARFGSGKLRDAERTLDENAYEAKRRKADVPPLQVLSGGVMAQLLEQDGRRSLADWLEEERSKRFVKQHFAGRGGRSKTAEPQSVRVL